jgi:hypothetical protein
VCFGGFSFFVCLKSVLMYVNVKTVCTLRSVLCFLLYVNVFVLIIEILTTSVVMLGKAVEFYDLEGERV